MKQVRFEFEELPYETLSQFGLTREMIEDLPMHILEELSHGRHSPVLPIKVNDDNGNTVTDRSRFAFVRKENGEADVVFYPVLKKSSLEKYSNIFILAENSYLSFPANIFLNANLPSWIGNKVRCICGVVSSRCT